jgi:hypothetical protein
MEEFTAAGSVSVSSAITLLPHPASVKLKVSNYISVYLSHPYLF